MSECECHIEKPLYEKWVIIPVWVASGGLSRIDWKFLANVKQCTGISYTLANVDGVFSQPRIGELALLFNNKLSHPLNFEIEQKSRNCRLDTMLLKLEQPIVSATRVSGFYRNLTTNAHTMNIYLQCIAETNE
jgi:hypothetical protein